ncbi:interferon-induced protein 44-like [Ruditapes philippinarum]|uniref:interferon-induced protein 44-like n=1 Tax=Ruditapes philippinarum TaxID=129788 RepID=UPI00295B2979|nr:interferon-induced protein 44-like [Ruditapes philippinarum]
MGQPWRKHAEDTKWTEKYSKTLRSKVRKIVLNETCKPTLLLLGPSGHGKSTLINSISTISNNRQSNIANSASAASTQSTTEFRRYELRGYLDTFRVADTAGVTLEENEQYLENILEIINGHIRPNKEFNVVNSTKDGDYYIKSPGESDKVHCVILVVDIRNFDKMNTAFKNYKRSIQKMLAELNKSDIPRILVLTHADKMDSNVNEDISKMFYSEKIKEAVEIASEALGIPLENIHPIVNYSNTSYAVVEPILHIPILLALQAALYFASDTLNKRMC